MFLLSIYGLRALILGCYTHEFPKQRKEQLGLGFGV